MTTNDNPGGQGSRPPEKNLGGGIKKRVIDFARSWILPQLAVSPTLTVALTITFSITVFTLTVQTIQDSGWSVVASTASTTRDVVIQQSLEVRDDVIISGSVLQMARSSCDEPSPSGTARLCFDSDNAFKLSANGNSYTDILTTGADGPQGIQGIQGIQGPQGEGGLTGPQGAGGATGLPGAKGDTGARGPGGPQGATGATGARGAGGDKGDTGARGPAGPKGDTGDKGDKGDTGPAGIAGIEIVSEVFTFFSVPPDSERGIPVACPAGTTPLSGTGYATTNRGTASSRDFAAGIDRWWVLGSWTTSDDVFVNRTLTVVTIVVCAP